MLKKRISSLLILAVLILPELLVGSAFADHEWFRIAKIDDRQETGVKRYVLDNPLAPVDPENPYSRNFIAFGMHGVYAEEFKEGHYPKGWGDDYTGVEGWITDQIKFFFAKNINTLGAKANFAPGDAGWYHPDAKADFDTVTGECSAPGGGYGHKIHGRRVGESARLHKRVNQYLPGKHASEPDSFPHNYFPFLSYVYITEPLYRSKLESGSNMPGWQMVPDVWHDNFEYESYLKAFLVLSDGAEIEGRWEYSEIDTSIDDPEVAEDSVLVVPYFWECHQPDSLLNHQALIAVILGYDVPHYWGDVKPSTMSHVCYLRPWMRALLAQRYDPSQIDTIPPARTAFVDAMVAQYDTTVSYWNQSYPAVTNGYDYTIDFFYKKDAEPDTELDRILETKDLLSDFEEGYTFRYPDGCFPGEPGDSTFTDWLRAPGQNDLGLLLHSEPNTFGPFEQTCSDAEAFKKKISEKYHQVAIDAIRFFDPNHMIFSECSNWTAGRPSGGWKDYDPSGLIQTIIETRGNYFNGNDDRIFAITTQVYPDVPEMNVIDVIQENDPPDPPDTTFCKSYHSKCQDIYHIAKTVYNNTPDSLIVPFLMGSYTIHADWEKEWDFNYWDKEGGQPCGWIDSLYRESDDWLKNAPYPHRVDGVEPDSVMACVRSKSYRYTETGLLDYYQEVVSGEEHNGRGMDFCIVSSALLEPMPFGEQDQVIFLGLVFHNMYDTELDEGYDTEDSENWGFVNQKVYVWGDSLSEEKQYLGLHHKYWERAGAIQVYQGPGEPWARDGAQQYPEPAVVEEFGEYEE